jgi:endoglucanase
VVAYAHQVGGTEDHGCGWIPPELRRPDLCPRAASFVTHGDYAADVTASTAAALAQISLAFQGVDAEYAEKCLSYAIALYNFATIDPEALADNGGLYTSEYAWDDLAWAAIWLHVATGDDGYLEDAAGTDGWVFHFPGFSSSCVEEILGYDYCWDCPEEPEYCCWEEAWAHVWNSVRSGVFVKLAHLLEASGSDYAPVFRCIARKDSMAWVEGPRSLGGFSSKFSVSWGSGRYNAAGQFVALVYAKYFPDDEPGIVDWARTQSEYLLGDNPLDKS